MIIRRYDPQNVFDTLSEAIDWAHDFDRIFELNELMVPNNKWGLYEGDWSPRLDMFEDEDAYYIKVDVPGVEVKDIDLNVTNNVLTIKGEKYEGVREDESKKRARKYQREERIYMK